MAKKAHTPAPEVPVVETPKAAAKVVFNKDKILKMERFANRRDACSVLLKDGKTYTVEQVESLIQNFMKGKVK